MPSEFSILIVEDDNDARHNMDDILSLDGYKTQLESHCLPAINAVERKKFDAVILDWRLPDSNADALLPIILREQPDTPVVVITGMRDFDASVEALRSGAYDFLVKPINPDVLRAVLSRLVERKSHLKKIQDSQAKLLMNERLAAIGQMVAGLAHESRNAFQRSHACLAELTLDLEDKPDSLMLVHKVQKALDDVHYLLEEVRDYSAPIVLERRQVNFPTLIQETWQQILDAQKVPVSTQIDFQVDDLFPETCFVDAARIQQVIRNLLENALFANKQTGQIVVRLSMLPMSNKPAANSSITNLRIEVGDEGEGISDENLEHIFTPFFTTKTKGTGLGLAVSRRIVDAHDGKIFAVNSANLVESDNSANSTDSKGATFIIELPSKSAKAPKS